MAGRHGEITQHALLEALDEATGASFRVVEQLCVALITQHLDSLLGKPFRRCRQPAG